VTRAIVQTYRLQAYRVHWWMADYVRQPFFRGLWVAEVLQPKKVQSVALHRH
jgi:hypothetical protein